jgi:hypothetical protein
MNVQQFAATVRAKHPGAYDDMDDATLTQKVLAKYPQYQDMVDSGPGVLKSGALGVMSGIPGAETAVSGLESTFTPKTYAEAHQGLEQAKDQAWENHPVAYGAGKVGGMVGTGLVAPEVEGLQGAAALGAGIGALSGADKAETPDEIPLNAIRNAPMGAALGAGANVAGNVLSAGAKWAAPRVLAGMTSKGSTADILDYAANPSAINSALDPAQRGPAIAAAASGIGKEAGALSNTAKGLLNPENSPLSASMPEPSMPDEATSPSMLGVMGKSPSSTATPTLDSLGDLVDQVKQQFLQNGVPKSGPAEAAVNALDAQMARIRTIAAKNGGDLTEPDMQEQIHELQGIARSVFGDNSDVASAKGAIGDLSGALNNSLKTANPAYGAAMVPTAAKTKLASQLADQFKLDPTEGGGYQASDATNAKVNAAMSDVKPEGGSLFDQVKNSTGQDLQDMMAKSQTKENLNAPGAGGPLKLMMTALGYGAGHNAGIPMGGIAGAAGGRAAAEGVNGASVAKSIVDMWQSGSKSVGGQTAAKFGPVLAQAAKIGGNQLAATHFVLATSNPEYQSLVDHVQNNQRQ